MAAPKLPTLSDNEVTLLVAQAINGPYGNRIIEGEQLLNLRRVKWSTLSPQRQAYLQNVVAPAVILTYRTHGGLTNREEDYAVCELENDNLRAILRWVDEQLPVDLHNALVEKMAPNLMQGGITTDGQDDLEAENAKIRRQIMELTEHVQRLIDLGRIPDDPMYLARLDHLLSQLREWEPKRPLMERVEGRPNVFRPIRGGVDE
jgi:hypothetical protein